MYVCVSIYLAVLCFPLPHKDDMGESFIKCQTEHVCCNFRNLVHLGKAIGQLLMAGTGQGLLMAGTGQGVLSLSFFMLCNFGPFILPLKTPWPYK